MNEQQLQELLAITDRFELVQKLAEYGIEVTSDNRLSGGDLDPNASAALGQHYLKTLIPAHVQLQLSEAQSNEEFNEIVAQAGVNINAQLYNQLFPEVANRVDTLDAERAEYDSFLEQASDPGSDGGETVTMNEQLAGQQGGVDTGVEDFEQEPWLLQMYQRPFTPEERAKILQNVNRMYGQSFTSWGELNESGFFTGQEQNQALTGIIDASLNTPIEESRTFRLNSGEEYSIKVAHLQVAQQRWGVPEEELVSFTKLVDAMGVKRSQGRIAWQPIFALARATGLDDDLTETVTSTTQRPTGGQPRGRGGGQTVTTTRNVSPDDVFFDRPDNVYNENQNVMRGEMFSDPSIRPVQQRVSLRDIATAFDEGLEKYLWDPGMAFVHAYDPLLANRISLTFNGTLTSLDFRDQYSLSGIVSNAGFQSRQDWQAGMIDAGYAEAENTGSDLMGAYFDRLTALDAQEELRRGGGADETGGRQAPIITLPDPVALDSAMKSLYEEMYFAEPTEQQLAAFRSQINGAISTQAGAEPGDTVTGVDIGARAEAFAKTDVKYGELYGKKTPGMSDAAYRQQFQAGQQSMLGDELAGNVAVKAGMRSGKYQTAVGAAAGTTEAWDNSTFMGRLAQAARVVGANT